ncbi:MAG: exosortase C-terminal domain/associated protein EpsI [Pirellulales bacterium]
MNKTWTTYIPIGAAAVLMLGVGYVQGLWSERWGTFPELQIFADQLAAVPMQIGEWQGKQEEGSNEKILQVAGATGEMVRSYTNANGETVRVSLICGREQDLTYHTPDRCYPAAGFDMQGTPQREVIELPGGQSAQFFAVNFTKSEPTGTHAERGFWSWTGDGNWLAPDNTKLTFASQRAALYKLYVFASLSPESKQGDRDYSREFLEVFIPTLNDALRPAYERAGRVEETAASPTPAEPATADAAG